MTILEFTESTNKAYVEYMLFQARWTSLMEAVENERSINIDQAKLKVMQENGTTEDFLSLVESADETAFEKFKKALKKLWEACVNALKTIKNKIVGFFSKDKEEKMKKIANSEQGKEKINVPEYNELKKAEKEYRSTVDSAYARFKAGRGGDPEELNKAKEKYTKKKKAILATTTVMSISAVIGTLFAIKKKNDKDYDNYTDAYDLPGGDSMKHYESKWAYFKDIKVHAKFIRVEEAMNDCRFIQFVQRKLHGVRGNATQVNVDSDILNKKVAKESVKPYEEALLDELIEST